MLKAFNKVKENIWEDGDYQHSNPGIVGFTSGMALGSVYGCLNGFACGSSLGGVLGMVGGPIAGFIGIIGGGSIGAIAGAMAAYPIYAMTTTNAVSSTPSVTYVSNQDVKVSSLSMFTKRPDDVSNKDQAPANDKYVEADAIPEKTQRLGL